MIESTDSTKPPIQAAILTGGMSSRMGQDKALLTIGGEPLLVRISRRLLAVDGISKVFAVGDRRDYHGRGIPVHADAFPRSGPLGGIATALKIADTSHVLVVATDMPFISPVLISAMVDIERNYDALVPVRPGRLGGQSGAISYEPLHAIYSTHSLGRMQSRLASGRHRLYELFEEIAVRALDEDWIGRYDPRFSSFINLNRPEDLERARAYANRGIARGGKK